MIASRQASENAATLKCPVRHVATEYVAAASASSRTAKHVWSGCAGSPVATDFRPYRESTSLQSALGRIIARTTADVASSLVGSRQLRVHVTTEVAHIKPAALRHGMGIADWKILAREASTARTPWGWIDGRSTARPGAPPTPGGDGLPVSRWHRLRRMGSSPLKPPSRLPATLATRAGRSYLDTL